MFMPSTALAAFALVLAASAACAEGPNLGRPIDPADIAPWGISIMPNGAGLPPGSGTAAQGAKLYAEKCSACHGDNGRGTEFGSAVVGGPPRATLDGGKTIRNYWPYATTLFDYIRRAMPFPQPNSLTNDEVYAVVAYLLQLNGIIGENETINAQILPRVQMPNRDGFMTFSRGK